MKKEYFDDQGRLHREDGPAQIFDTGEENWCFHGKLHRIGGPAVVRVDYFEYWVDGKLHRTDGPAREFVGPFSEYSEWHVDGKCFFEKKEFDRYICKKRIQKLFHEA